MTDAMSEIYILVYAETTLLIIGSSMAAVFPIFQRLGLICWGATSNAETGSHNGTPLKTFGQRTSRRKGLTEDDEITLNRSDATGDTSETSLGGIVKRTDVEQTWGPAENECPSMSRSRKMGLTPVTAYAV